MKTVQEILAGLPEEDRGVLVADRDTALLAEKNKGILAAKQARDNVSKLLSRKEELEAALTEAGIDLESETAIDAIKELKKAKPSGKADPEWKAELAKRDKLIAEIRAETQAEKDKVQKLRKAGAIATLNAKLKGKIYNHEDAAEMLFLRGKVTVKDDGAIVFPSDDEEIDLDKGIEQYIADRPEIAINTTNGGGGSSGGNGGGAKKKQMVKDDWLKLETKARAEFMAAGGILT